MDLVRTKHKPTTDHANNILADLAPQRPSPNHRVFFVEYEHMYVYVWWIDISLLAPTV